MVAFLNETARRVPEAVHDPFSNQKLAESIHVFRLRGRSSRRFPLPVAAEADRDYKKQMTEMERSLI